MWRVQSVRAIARSISAFVSTAAALAAAGALASPATASADSPPPLPSAGDVVAILELASPTVGNFVLHGTVPVPPGTYPRPDGLVPLQVVDSDGALVPTQLEVVSRYPAPADGADVVEVIARVRRPPGSPPGTRIRYHIVYDPMPRGSLREQDDVRELLGTPNGIVLRARDVFGNLYTTDLLADYRNGGSSLRILKNGAQTLQAETHESLRPAPPIPGVTGTLPHLMGVHAYATQWSGKPYLGLDLRVHSAHSGLDSSSSIDDPLGKIYFESIELVLPSGWVVLDAVPNPYTGLPYVDGGSLVWPIVCRIGQGKLHVLPQLGQFHRRLMIARADAAPEAMASLREEGLGFCREGRSPTGTFGLWSWWNPQTARYFPQRHRLPSLDHVNLDVLRNADEGELGVRVAQVSSGSSGPWPAQAAGLGWAHPWGIEAGGMVSGLEINLYEGVTTACAASNAGYRVAQLVHRMLSDRQPNVLFDADGKHTRMQEWVLPHPQGPILPVWWFGRPLLYLADPFGVTSSPNFQRVAVAALGKQPPWENAFLNYEPIDAEHLIRYTRMAKVLAWLGNDAIAKDDLRAQAEGVLMGYNMYRQDHYPGGVVSTGMLSDRMYVDFHPGWGFSYGRAEGWGLDTMNAAYSLADPAWRSDVRPWFDLVIDVVRDGQMDCTGIIQASYLNNVFNGAFRCRQSIEAAIIENGLVGMRESVFRDESPLKFQLTNEVLRKALYAMISPLVWDDASNGPWALFAVGTANANAPPFCTYWPPEGNYGIPDHYQIWSSFAYAYEITRDPRFLNKASEAMGGSNLLGMCMAMGAAEIQNRAALLALVQSL